jgi:cytochrome c peroxidase
MKQLFYFTAFALLMTTAACVADQVDVRTEYYYPEEYAAMQQVLNLPETPLNYDTDLPRHLAVSGLFARDINEDLATLGRVLFYDKALSSTGEVSCASCHKQELAFADDKVHSVGVNGNESERNSLALGSVVSFAAYYGSDFFGTFGVPFMWDNRFGTARDQARAAFTSQKEMGMDMPDIVRNLRDKPHYAPLFRRAFGTQDVTEERVLSAVAEFIDGLSTSNTKYDQAAAKMTNAAEDIPFGDFTAAENRGKSIYLTSCAGCHSPVFGRPVINAANNGLDMAYADEGVGSFTQRAEDMYRFKVPTLRNVALTAPYMHDGRFQTLEQVVDHYSEGIADHPKLDQRLRKPNGEPNRLQLNATDKAALLAFLHTLTDTEYLTLERYSDPFK